MALVHYEGDLGVFDYDDTQFKLMWLDGKHLRYTGTETDGAKIHIPEGIADCSFMFRDANITTPPIIPEGVGICKKMFEECVYLEKAPRIPEGVTDCSNMFEWCIRLNETPIIPRSAINCNEMFWDCRSLEKAPVIPQGVTSCERMFMGCEGLEIPPEIPDSVTNCSGMFAGCSEKIQKQGEWNIEHRGQSYTEHHKSIEREFGQFCPSRESPDFGAFSFS